MSDKLVYQAISEALGADAVKEKQSVLEKRAGEFRSSRKLSDTASVIEAAKEVYGVGLFSPNIERQITERVRALEANPDAGVPGSGSGKPAEDPNKGSDVGKPRLNSIKGDIEGDVNAMQKEAFEAPGGDRGASGTNNSASVVRSKVASQTNSANTTGGPGAGSPLV